VSHALPGQNKIDMTEGPLFTKLLRFSIPLIFSSFLQLLFNAADVVVVGRFAGDNSLAAVGSTGSLINLLINLFMGLSIGTNVVVARYFGAKQHGLLRKTIHTAMLVSVYSGLILTAVGVGSARGLLILMQAPEEVLGLAATYLKVYFGGITATMVYNFGSAILRAKGDTQRPLYILFLAGIINLLLNLFFVIVLKMDVAGVALATVLSQCLSAALVVLILCREQDEFRLELRRMKIDGALFMQIVRIGLPAGFQGIMFSFSNVIIQSSVNSFGAVLIAGNSAACNLEGFIYTSMNGFSQGALTFCSQNLGANKTDRIRRTVWISQLSIAVIGAVMSAVFLFFGRQLLGIYTTSPAVVEAGMSRLWVIFTTYYLCGMMDGMSNAIRGIGHSLLPVITSLLGACVFRIIWLSTVFMMPQFHRPLTIFLSYPLSWTLTFAANIVAYVRYMRHLDGERPREGKR